MSVSGSWSRLESVGSRVAGARGGRRVSFQTTVAPVADTMNGVYAMSLKDPVEHIDYEFIGGRIVWYCICPQSCTPTTICPCRFCVEFRLYEKHATEKTSLMRLSGRME